MCGFGVSNIHKLLTVNNTCQKRGPDLTTTKIIYDIEFLHNLLHITGNYTPQPFIKNDIACVFNGEIYNYKDLGDYSSDGESIIDSYIENGKYFASYLDGEFAIVLIDFSKNIILLATDTFATKPLWYEFLNNKFCISSYQSQLEGLGFKNSKKLLGNTTLIFDNKTFAQIDKIFNYNFDLNQHKNIYDDWLNAFSVSISKRSKNTKQGMFVGLSSGYDSGAIACELAKQSVPFKSYSISNNENSVILNSRLALLKNTESFILDSVEYKRWKNELDLNCEDFCYTDRFFTYDIKKDQASAGLSAICYKAKKENKKIYFSGQGADEIISDYGFGGKKIYKHSSFGGLFPEKLEGFFPWHSFWDGTQIQYLNKEEYVAGHFGIETRYPFLDKNLVQEFLWLNVNLKNKKYKSCLAEYLEINNFPFENGEKRGFHVTEKGKKTKKIKK